MFWCVFAIHYYSLALAIWLRQVRAFLNDPQLSDAVEAARQMSV